MTNVDSAACAEKAGRDQSESIKKGLNHVLRSQTLLLGSSFLGATGKLILLFLLNALRCRTGASVLPMFVRLLTAAPR